MDNELDNEIQGSEDTTVQTNYKNLQMLNIET